jgi:DNA-binding NtrC family response regulator
VVVAFDRTPCEVARHIGDLSGHGERRLIAIAVLDRVLDGTSAWRLLQVGASDVFSWDACPSPCERIGRRLERWEAIDRVMDDGLARSLMVGRARKFRAVLRQIVEVARFSDASVLITGESGTGKELVARLIHDLDARPKKGNFVVVDCTTIVPELSGSEFFGHEKGAFTGAVASREGAVALANGGTLFLDEVGDLPLQLQAELLRLVQERTYKRVGGNTWSTTQFRLVCATHRDLQDEQHRGRFRQDLYYRLSDWTCRLPSLRERLEDVVPLVEHFLRAFVSGRPVQIDDAVRQHLLLRPYPGNIRELRQVAFRIACRYVGPGPVTVGDLGPDEAPSGESGESWCEGSFAQSIQRAIALGVGLKEIRRVAEDTAVRLAVSGEDGNLQSAARRLGVTDRALQLRRASQRPTS